MSIHRRIIIFLELPVNPSNFLATGVNLSYSPASLRRISALSVFSQFRFRSVRPKWP